MPWSGDVHAMVLADFKEAAKLKGAKSPDEVTVVEIPARVPDVTRRRRIVPPRSYS